MLRRFNCRYNNKSDKSDNTNKNLQDCQPKNIYTVDPKQFYETWRSGGDVSDLLNKVSWIQMSMYKEKLPEEFLMQFSKYIQWLYAYKYQQLSCSILENTGCDFTKWNVIV